MSAFGDAFKAARKKFEKSGSAGDFVFEHPKGSGKKFNVLKAGEKKAQVMKKFSAPKTSLRPKLRPKAAEPVARAGDQDKGDSYDALMKKKRDAKKKADAQKRPDSGVFKSLNKDLNAQRKASSAERRGPPSTPVKKRRDSKDNQSQSQSGISANAENTLKARLRQREADKRQREKDRRNKARSEAARLEKGLNSKPAERPRSNTRFPVGEVSSSRGRGDPDKIRAGDEKNALDTAAERRAIAKLMGLNKGGMTKKSGYMYGGSVAKKKPVTKMMGGGMAKKKTMTYNMGGMVKSQVNNLKGKK